MMIITDMARKAMRDALLFSHRNGNLKEIKRAREINSLPDEELFNFFIMVTSRLLTNK